MVMMSSSNNNSDQIQSSVVLHGTKISSVVPGRATGDNKLHQLTPLDLSLKLHYIRGLYFFKAEAVRGLSIYDMKLPMFALLELYSSVSGRIRSGPDSGRRPYIRCNDGGVRIVEACCDDFSVDEWLAREDCGRNDDGLVYNQVLGPDLEFSPLVYVQFTWFKCGGMSLGLSWAHVVGDPFSASSFINKWAQIMAGSTPSEPLHVPSIGTPKSAAVPKKLLSVKRVDPVGDYWVTAGNCKMEAHSFVISSDKLDQLMREIRNPSQAIKISEFEVLSAIIWRSMTKVRDDSGPRIVTICTNSTGREQNETPRNGMVFNIVESDLLVSKAGVSDLAAMIAEKTVEENEAIEDFVGRDNGEGDYVVYGANMTFVNLEEMDVYGLELKGQKPIFVNYSIGGVGDEGVVLVLPGPPETGAEEGRVGRVVTVMLPENQVVELKDVLQRDWGLA